MRAAKAAKEAQEDKSHNQASIARLQAVFPGAIGRFAWEIARAKGGILAYPPMSKSSVSTTVYRESRVTV